MLIFAQKLRCNSIAIPLHIYNNSFGFAMQIYKKLSKIDTFLSK